MKSDWRTADLSQPDRALAEFALALNREPNIPDRRARVAALREAGFDDAGILAATQVCGYFNYVNRLAEGLGVELERR